MPVADADIAKRHLDWLLCEIQKYEAYHNHKETMAWVATSFYIPLIITYGVLSRSVVDTWKTAAFVGIILSFVSVLFFVNMQFRMRWEAADIQIGLMNLVADLSLKAVTLPARPIFASDREHRFPDHIWLYVRNAENRKPKRRVRRWLPPPCSWRDNRAITEVASYFLILVSTVAAIVIHLVEVAPV